MNKKSSQTTYVYYLLHNATSKVKIGITESMDRRLKNLQHSNGGEKITVIKSFEFQDGKLAHEVEWSLHQMFALFRVKETDYLKRTEWFDYEILRFLITKAWELPQLLDIRVTYLSAQVSYNTTIGPIDRKPESIPQIGGLPKTLPLRQAAAQSGLSYDCLRKMCLNNEISYIKAGNKYMVNVDSLTNYLNQGEAL